MPLNETKTTASTYRVCLICNENRIYTKKKKYYYLTDEILNYCCCENFSKDKTKYYMYIK